MTYDDVAKAILEKKLGLIESIGIFALKTLLTLNAGATVVLLALLGSLQDDTPKLTVDVPALQYAMIAFLVGIVFVLVSIAVTYVLAQLSLANWPDGEGFGMVPHLMLMMVPAIVSFLAFGYGFVSATWAFSAAG